MKENENKFEDTNKNQKIIFSLNTNNTNEKIKLKDTLNTNNYNINNNANNTKTSSHNNKVRLPNNIYEKNYKKTNQNKKFSLKTPLVDKKRQLHQPPEPELRSNIGSIKSTNLPKINIGKQSPAIIREKHIIDVKKNLYMDFLNKNDGFEDIYSIDSNSTNDYCLINKCDSRLGKHEQTLTFYNFIQKNPFLITNSLNLPIKTIDFNLVKY